MFLKPSVLSSHHDCCHSRLIPGSCLKMARHTARYCISFPSAIIFAKRRYSSLCASFHWRISALNCSYVCFCPSIFVGFLGYKIIKEEYDNQSKRLTSSFFISSSILRYRAKARLPSECPDMEAIRFGSLTCRYRLPMKVLRAVCVVATSYKGFATSTLVFGSRTMTVRSMPTYLSISFIFLL